MSLPSSAFFFITGQKVPETRERNLSAIIRLMNAEVFSFLITVISLQTRILHSPNSQIDKTVASKAIQVLNKGSNYIYNTGINLVCSAVTCLCIVRNFPMTLKHKSCNVMSDNSIIVTNEN